MPVLISATSSSTCRRPIEFESHRGPEAALDRSTVPHNDIVHVLAPAAQDGTQSPIAFKWGCAGRYARSRYQRGSLGGSDSSYGEVVNPSNPPPIDVLSICCRWSCANTSRIARFSRAFVTRRALGSWPVTACQHVSRIEHRPRCGRGPMHLRAAAAFHRRQDNEAARIGTRFPAAVAHRLQQRSHGRISRPQAFAAAFVSMTAAITSSATFFGTGS